MKKIRIHLFILGMIFILFLSACGQLFPTPTEPPTEPPPKPATEPPPEPVDLAGPPMEIGSKYLYVDGSILIAIPAGDFIMGHNRDDNPEHTAYLDDYWIYRSPVTNEKYRRCVELGGCSLPDLKLNPVFYDPERANDPVVGVNWAQAEDYCNLFNGHVASEAQYEKMARFTDGRLYPWGDAAPSCDLLNAADCVHTTTDVTKYAHAESPYGAFDSVGNVWEWAFDWYDSKYYTTSSRENPFGPELGQRKSVRSSGFEAAFFETEIPRRFSAKPIDARNDLGFRCVPEDPMWFAPFCEWVMAYGFDFEAGIPMPATEISSCPTIKFQEAKFCVPVNQAYTNVKVWAENPPTSLSSVDHGFCNDLGSNKYHCTPATHSIIEGCAPCQVKLVGTGHCPPNTTPDGDICRVEAGWPGRCLPGYEFDEELECCQVTEISIGIFPTCPDGTYFTFPPPACVNYPTASEECDDFEPGYDSCGYTYSSYPESSPLAAALVEEQPKTPVAPISGVLTLTALGLVGWVFYGRKRS